MARPNEGPVEAFRQVTAAATRAVARRSDLTVSFAPEAAGLHGSDLRLPLPPRDLPAAEVAVVRGEADAVALHMRHHDEKLHSKRQPMGAQSRAIFDAVEQTRCEALGARRMAGVAANLTAALDQRCRQQGFSRMAEREQAPLPQIVALLARERLRLTRASSPASRLTWLMPSVASVRRLLPAASRQIGRAHV